eukprot:CAMPEP_0114989668 /NCGR_PEP_ID=MMETSP0216-20121206/10329_1 /TAXON_ID=223996 /ORGANISM="Protocruzia adherens, Strain Boccale" /LENGTH=301 /DNA_ID=CAMNT_0002352679 /DNA_START=151 /DNA_END=1053 /DNA_ORIENTATION=-
MIKTTLAFYSINKAEGGLIGSLQMTGFLIASLVVGLLSKTKNTFKLIYFSLFFWIAALFMAGVSYNYGMITTARIFDGACRAPASILINPMINIIAPEGLVTRWVAIMLISRVIGAATGSFLAPAIVNSLGSILWTFRLEVLYVVFLLIPPIFFWKKCVRVGEVSKRVKQEKASNQNQAIQNESDVADPVDSHDIQHQLRLSERKQIWEDVKKLLSNKIFLCLSVGGASLNFAFGGVGYWAIQYIEDDYGLSNESAALWTGSLSAILGLTAPLLGGLFLDSRLKSIPKEDIWQRLRIIFRW